ncbi:MAG: glycosyltransferase family 2 protein [Nitrososphaeria archaeon]|nr:glycosyltransferase family 2 protein [Nitrososphaeria archaeon]
MMLMTKAVDAIMLTKNSIRPCLKECLDSIYKNIPINNLIVVDGGSSDGTLELLKRYPRVKIIMDTKGNRATSRQLGIKAVETEWFIFLDSDVILCDKWFEYVKPYLSDPKVGAVWGAALQRDSAHLARYSAMSKLYGKDEFWIAVKAGRKRGLTHDTIIRTKAVEGIIIPNDLHVLEDHYIRMYVEKKGYLWLSVPRPYCYHFTHTRERPRDYFIFGKAARKIGFLKLPTVIMYLLLGVPKSIWIYISTKNSEAARTQYLTYIYIIKGWINGGN